MTKLEEEIRIAIDKLDRETPRPLYSSDQAKAAASVAKKYIEKAHEAGFFAVAIMGFDSQEQSCKKFMEREGIL